MSKTKKTEQTNTSTSKQTTDPRYTNAAYDQYAQAAAAAGGYQPIVIPDAPALNPDQIAAQDAARKLVAGGSTLGGLKEFGQGLLNYQPQQVGAQQISTNGFNFTPTMANAAMASASLANRGDIRDISAPTLNAQQFSQGDIDRVMGILDPSYKNAVLDSSLRTIDEQRQRAQFGEADQAARAGAFGGSRYALREADTNRAFGQIAGDTTANLNMDFYRQALGLSQADVDRRQQAELARAGYEFGAAQSNQGVDANVALTNAGLGTQTNIANAGYGTQASIASANSANQAAIAQAQMALDAQRANQGASLTAGLANQQAGFQAANLGLDAGQYLTGLDQIERNRSLQDIELLDAVGLQNYNQALAQNAVNTQNQYNQQQAPLDQLSIVQSALGYLPQDPTMTSSGKSFTKETVPFDWAQLIGTGLQVGSKVIPSWRT